MPTDSGRPPNYALMTPEEPPNDAKEHVFWERDMSSGPEDIASGPEDMSSGPEDISSGGVGASPGPALRDYKS